jgi:hypothetical protein
MHPTITFGAAKPNATPINPKYLHNKIDDITDTIPSII